MSVRPVAVLQLPWVRQAMALGMLATGAGLLWQFPQPLLLALLLVSLTTMACWPLAPAVAESAGADTPDSGDLPLSEGERAIWHEVEQLAEQQAGQYDVVTCMEMLEHVPDPASIIQACQKLVKPGGHVFFSTINRNPKSYLFAIIGAEYVLRMLAKGTHDYHKFIKPSELAHDIRQAGLKLKDMTGLHYNPLTKRYWLAPNVDVNYMVYTVNEVTE